jgi:hypothetical protein
MDEVLSVSRDQIPLLINHKKSTLASRLLKKTACRLPDRFQDGALILNCLNDVNALEF